MAGGEGHEGGCGAGHCEVAQRVDPGHARGPKSTQIKKKRPNTPPHAPCAPKHALGLPTPFYSMCGPYGAALAPGGAMGRFTT